MQDKTVTSKQKSSAAGFRYGPDAHLALELAGCWLGPGIRSPIKLLVPKLKPTLKESKYCDARPTSIQSPQSNGLPEDQVVLTRSQA